MFPIWNILAALPWRLIAAGVLAAVLFAGGCQFGTNRVTAKWDAEKAATAEAVAKQAEHVAAVTVHQSTINQEISNDFQKAKAAITADRQRLLARVPVSVRIVAPDHPGPVPAHRYDLFWVFRHAGGLAQRAFPYISRCSRCHR